MQETRALGMASNLITKLKHLDQWDKEAEGRKKRIKDQVEDLDSDAKNYKTNLFNLNKQLSSIDEEREQLIRFIAESAVAYLTCSKEEDEEDGKVAEAVLKLVSFHDRKDLSEEMRRQLATVSSTWHDVICGTSQGSLFEGVGDQACANNVAAFAIYYLLGGRIESQADIYRIIEYGVEIHNKKQYNTEGAQEKLDFVEHILGNKEHPIHKVAEKVIPEFKDCEALIRHDFRKFLEKNWDVSPWTVPFTYGFLDALKILKKTTEKENFYEGANLGEENERRRNQCVVGVMVIAGETISLFMTREGKFGYFDSHGQSSDGMGARVQIFDTAKDLDAHLNERYIQKVIEKGKDPKEKEKELEKVSNQYEFSLLKLSKKQKKSLVKEFKHGEEAVYIPGKGEEELVTLEGMGFPARKEKYVGEFEEVLQKRANEFAQADELFDEGGRVNAKLNENLFEVVNQTFERLEKIRSEEIQNHAELMQDEPGWFQRALSPLVFVGSVVKQGLSAAGRGLWWLVRPWRWFG